jgi:hypothetical protein
MDAKPLLTEGNWAWSDADGGTLMWVGAVGCHARELEVMAADLARLAHKVAFYEAGARRQAELSRQG